MVLNKLNNQLRISIVIDDLSIFAWRKKIIDGIINSPFAEISQILTIPGEQKSKNKLCKYHIQLDAWYFKPKPYAFEKSEALKNIEPYIFRNWSIEQPLQRAADCILWLSEQTPSPIFLQKQHVPIFAFVHGSENTLNSYSLGYLDFLDKKEVLSSALVCYAGDRFKLIERTWSMMQTMSISRSRNEHFWKLSTILLRALEKFYRLSHTDKKTLFCTSLIDLPKPVKNNPHRIPFNKSISCLWNHALRFGVKTWRKIQYQEQWIILLDMQKGINKNFSDFKKILPPKDVFWADPFLIEDKGQHFLFFEELPFATWKGHLSVSEIDGLGNISKPKKILDLPYHLSYPFIFKFDDRFYMIPESYEAGKIQLFEARSFPDKWEHKMDLMNEVTAFDTTLFFHNEKWWMFTVLANEGSGHNDELFLFYAENPLTDQWTSHPKNPIVSDVRSARPAGNIYIEDGKIIRPSQDCARKYGYGFHLNEIEILSETDYREKSILHVRPDWEKSITRTHSFNHSSKATVIDAAIQRSRFF